MWEGAAPGAYNQSADLAANNEQKATYADRTCKVN
jgi:hypothetical protein